MLPIIERKHERVYGKRKKEKTNLIRMVWLNFQERKGGGFFPNIANKESDFPSLL